MSRQSVEISHEHLEELTSVFESIDLDGNGGIDVAELGTALEICGFKLPQYEVRLLLAKHDKKVQDGKIDFSEFRSLYAQLKKEKDFGGKYKKAVKERTGVQTLGGSSDGASHSVRDAETSAFTDWMNKNLQGDPDCQQHLPLAPDGSSLYTSVKDGILLCKLINTSVPETIDERAINKPEANKTTLNVYKRTENQNLALMSASSIGCNIVNIGPGDIESGTPHLVLGMIWQIIRIGLLNDINLAANPNLVALLEEGETIEDLLKLSPEAILIRWVNYHLRNAGCDKHISNFSGDIKDSEAYTYLLHQIAPREKGVTLAPLGDSDMESRAESMLEEANKIECRAFVGPKDVCSGNARLNLAFVANLFNTYPALDKTDMPDVDIPDETREEKTYRNWMNSMGVNPFVHYLYNDLHDGLVIFQLYDIIQPGKVNWKRVIKAFNKMRASFERLENCNYAVELGKEMKFSLVGIGGEDILQGNNTLTLALVWQLMRAYTLAILTGLDGTGRPIDEKVIIEWANTKLKECGKSSSFSSFQDSKLQDGKVIIDLIDCIRKSINYDVVKVGSTEEERMANAKYAISMARRAGAKVYALPEDIVELKAKMIMTIFACLMMRDPDLKQGQEED